MIKKSTALKYAALFTSLFLPQWLGASYQLEIGIAVLSPIPQEHDPSALPNAVNYFFKIVEEQCELSISPSYSYYPTWELPFERFEFDSVPVLRQLESGPANFSYFQYPLWQMLESAPSHFIDHHIKILNVPNLDGYCGFAFPEVQFSSTEQSPQSPVSSRLKNNLLINFQQSGCGSYQRLVAHELAHLMVQDNPAHMCENEDKQLRPCPENNLLSVFRTLSPKPPVHKFPGKPNFPFPQDNFDPAMPQKLPSIGTQLTPGQCQAIAHTVKKLVNRH